MFWELGKPGIDKRFFVMIQHFTVQFYLFEDQCIVYQYNTQYMKSRKGWTEVLL